jgi:cellulose synthase/poly-beta-1,6-N-acetylglucosamine synthase-like glycosyltransferase
LSISEIFLLLILSVFILSITINIPNGFYLIFISLKGRSLIKKETQLKANKSIEIEKYQSISMLLTVLNEESQISELLDNMLMLEYPGDLEILLLDDGSTDETLNIAKTFATKFQDKSNIKFQIINKNAVDSLPSRGKFENLNRGLQIAKGTIIGILDSDARLEKDALTQVVKGFALSNDEVVGIQIPWIHRNRNESWLTKTFVTGIEIHQQIMQRGRLALDVMIPTYGSGEFWLASSLKSVKGWNDVITEDIELSYRIQLKKEKVNLTFQTYSNQLAPSSLSAFVQQQSRWAAGFFQTFKRLGPNILLGGISKRGKLDSILYMIFYGLPAITYINFLCFCLIAILYDFQPLLNISLIFGLIIFLIIGLIGSIILQALIFKQQFEKSFFKSLFWSAWLSLTGLALAPFFFKAMIDGFFRKKLEFKVTPKAQNIRNDRRRFLPRSIKLTSVFVFHVFFISLLLFHAFSVFNLSTEFLSIASYLGTLISINILFTFLSF